MSWLIPAIAIASSLLSSKKSAGSSTSTPTTVQTLTDDQMKLLEQLTENSTNQLNQYGGGMQTAPKFSVDTQPQEQEYLDWVSQLGQSRAVQNLMSGQPGYEVGPEYAEQLYEQSIRPAYMQEYERITQPGIAAAYAGPGYWGSARAGAQGQAAQDLATTLGSAKAQLMYGEEQAKRSAIDNAYNRMGSATETIGGQYASAAEYARGIEQEKAAEKLQRYLMGELVDPVFSEPDEVGGQRLIGGHQSYAYNPYLNVALSLLGIQPYSTGSTTTTKQPVNVAGAVNTGLNVADYFSQF